MLKGIPFHMTSQCISASQRSKHLQPNASMQQELKKVVKKGK